MKSVKTQLQERRLDDMLAQLAVMQDELDSLLAHGRMFIDSLNKTDHILSRPEARPYPYE